MWSSAYTYTSFNSPLKITDARGVEKHFMYDNLNRLIQVWYTGLGGDDNGNVKPPLPSGVRPTNGVIYTVDTSNTSTTKGMLLSISMTGSLPTYQETFSYDGLDRVDSRTWSRDGQNFTTGYLLDQSGEATQLTYPSGRQITENVDGTGRLSSLTEPGTGASYFTGITYDSAGRVIADSLATSTPINETFGYDSLRMQLTSQVATEQGQSTGNEMNLNYSYAAAAAKWVREPRLATQGS